MQLDPAIIFGIISSIGGLFGAISILWNIRKHRQEQKRKAAEKLRQSIKERTPLFDIEYREVQRMKTQGKKLVLGEITLTNKATYDMYGVGIFLSIANLKFPGFPVVSLKDNLDNDSDEINEEFGNLVKLKQYYFLYVRIGGRYLYKHLLRVEHDYERLSREKRVLEKEGPYVYCSSSKYGLKEFFHKYSTYTLDPNVPLVIPVIFEYSGEGFYTLKFGLSSVPTGKWEGLAEELGIYYREQKVEQIETTVQIPALTFGEEWVRYLD